MKRTSRETKVKKLFGLHPQMIAMLEKEARRTGRTQTKVLEMALAEFFSVKQPSTKSSSDIKLGVNKPLKQEKIYLGDNGFSRK